MQKILFKKLSENAKIPEYQTENSVGADVYSAEDVIIEANKIKIVNSDLSTEFPPNLEIQIRGRSGLASKGILTHLGTIDSDYRGNIGVLLINTTNEPYEIKKGDRIAQMVVNDVPVVEFKEVKDLSKTERGTGGFGHTGK